MAREIPKGVDQYLLQEDWATKKEINADDYEEVVKNTHFLYSKAGFRCHGRHYNPPLEQDDTNFTVINDNGTDLDTWKGVGRFDRVFPNGGVGWEFSAIAQDAEVLVNATRLDPDGSTTPLGSATADSNKGSFDHLRSGSQETEDKVSIQGNASNGHALVLFDIEIKAIDADPQNHPAKLKSWVVYEEFLGPDISVTVADITRTSGSTTIESTADSGGTTVTDTEIKQTSGSTTVESTADSGGRVVDVVETSGSTTIESSADSGGETRAPTSGSTTIKSSADSGGSSEGTADMQGSGSTEVNEDNISTSG